MRGGLYRKGTMETREDERKAKAEVVGHCESRFWRKETVAEEHAE